MNKKVLWIRHCEACHNKLSLSQKLFTSRLFKEPLCKVKAVKEAKKIGRNISKYNWRETSHSMFDDHSQAYFPHMDKEHGIHVSLNLECNK